VIIFFAQDGGTKSLSCLDTCTSPRCVIFRTHYRVILTSVITLVSAIKEVSFAPTTSDSWLPKSKSVSASSQPNSRNLWTSEARGGNLFVGQSWISYEPRKRVIKWDGVWNDGPRYNTGGSKASGSLTMIEIKKWGARAWKPWSISIPKVTSLKNDHFFIWPKMFMNLIKIRFIFQEHPTLRTNFLLSRNIVPCYVDWTWQFANKQVNKINFMFHKRWVGLGDSLTKWL
jgi:hypothetical protein